MQLDFIKTELHNFKSSIEINELPIQYMGSKKRIAEKLIENISAVFPDKSLCVDVFAGSGSVSRAALKQGFEVICNDLQPYSYTFLSPKRISPVFPGLLNSGLYG